MLAQWRVAALTAVVVILKVHAFPPAHVGEVDEDIPDINSKLNLDLFEGDIAGDSRRNAILDENMRWKFPIPYILTDSLDLNAKGVIHQAFEAYRLKSCVDFKPYEGESTYISFTKLSGCWSFVGDFRTGQNLSIGARCDTKAIVEHELLHALGFYHEQSRSDRDDYVKIWWDQIQEGMEHNFNKYEDNTITDLNTPYDYESIMHYRPLSFNKNESIPTITTTIPAFNEIIGQRLDFSAVDLTRLNRLYDCASTHTLLDQCSFEQINICGMIQNNEDSADWVQTLRSGMETDHTLAGRCRDVGYFMKFDTSVGEVGNSAILESRILYPRRSQQCLQFFYRMTGHAGDKLAVWLRTDDGTGNVQRIRKLHTITGDGVGVWNIAHVTLTVTTKFRYFFHGSRGSTVSSGAILLDDITLTETACPRAAWTIQNFTHLLSSEPFGGRVRSPRFYNAEGYGYGVDLYANGRNGSSPDYVGVTFHLFSGENDAVLEWPVASRQMTVTIMDQDPDVKLRMSSSRSFTTDTSSSWNRPTASSGSEWDESCRCYRGPELGWGTFISHKQLNTRSFLKNQDLIILADFVDLTHLIKTEVPVKPVVPSDDTLEKQSSELTNHRAVRSAPSSELTNQRAVRSSSPCLPNHCLNGGVCVVNEGKTSCRCASGQASFYAGARCEQQHVDSTIVGLLVGGTLGTLLLALAILTVIRSAH
ncbi:meprin A subunit alpha [Hypomesus transpacificus]|uniref:meprin A subunit alpha n=1 Tax=Hypomesus transpacificus TaxID=137520 RepID=UPI001F075EEF|nr:meprin A subunit alpha [Hypomesus transpacificus]